MTSLCPLLPGQPVNILNVPVILPDTDYLHRRDNSTSSTKSEKRTMDPEDKYMNPRTPPKPRPGLPRLKTSPPFYQQTTPSSSSLNVSSSNDERPAMSQPSSSTHGPMYRLVPRVKAERSVSPPRSRGLRAALLNIAGARSPGDHVEDRGISRPHDAHPADYFVPTTSTSNPSSNYSSRLTSPMSSPVELDGREIGRLPFRHPQVETEQPQGPPSIRVRRASKSSRENTPLALSLESHSSQETDKLEMSGFSRTAPLDTLEEALSQQATPMAVTSKEHTPVLLDPREKRLPTLPNSPSSVLDAELRAIEARYKPLDMELLYSHFSDDTSFAASNLYDSPQENPEKSRFSEWSTDTDLVSPASMTSSSTFNADQLSNASPILGHEFQHNSTTTNNDYTVDAPIPTIAISGPTTPVLGSQAEIILSPTEMDSDNSPLLISAHSSSAAGQLSPNYVHEPFEFSSLHIEDYDDECSFHEPDPKRQGAILPLSVVTPLSVDESSYCLTSPTRKEHQYRLSDDYTSQSAAMQELMDEIGYLGEMISSGL